jgi:OOP family OmpA-OmpF porin
LKLSQRRAQSVLDYLQQHGVKDSLIAKGYGENFPIADNKTEAGRVRNRRVELHWLGK